jgi:transposase
MTIAVEFKDGEIEALRHERFHHPHPRVQMRMEALYLKGKGLANDQICDLLEICPNTLRGYFRLFLEGGVEKLKEVNFYKPESRLAKEASSIEERFRENPPGSLKQAASEIETLTGIKRSVPQVRQFLNRIGMKRLKVGTVPAKADVDEQEEFVKKKLEPKLEEARAGKRAVFFVDAAHFVLAPFIGFLWCFARIFIKAPAGRKRFNVLGAIDAITHELVSVTNDTYINAPAVCELLEKIRKRRPDTPATLVLDNARYQKCKLVSEKAKELKIDLLYLPPYSPNLNLIERLWKFVKKKCLYSRYYNSFDLFKQSISDCLEGTGTIYKNELDTLLNPKFQTFRKAQIMAL